NIGRMSRITLTYHQQEERASAPPSTMICKCFGTRTRDSFVAAMIPLARNENLAYTDEQFVNLMQGLQPAVYYCSVSHFGLGFILMEDLSVTNRTKKSRDGVTLEELGMMWTAAARLHSRTLGMSSQALERISHMFEWTGPLFDVQIKSAVNLLSGPWETRLRPYPRLLHAISQLQNVELVNQLHVKLRGFDVYSHRPRHARPTPFCAVVHGDARVDNCFFNDSRKTVRFVDWQTVALRSPMQDIGWSLIDGGANAMHMPPIELLTAMKTSNSPISTDDSKRVADAAARCRESIFHLIETRYLKVLEQERSEPRNVSGGLSNGVVPSLSYCQEMLPWTVFFCVMTFAGSCGGGVVVEDPTNPVTMTFSAYMARIEWMLCVFVQESFWTPSR
ncbi:Hypothetical protein, putative, partial [Bodo saltans]